MNSKPSNIFRLRIKNIKYEVNTDFDSVKTICTIRYINPITHHVQKSKGVAKCPINEYISEIGNSLERTALLKPNFSSVCTHSKL